MLGVDDCVTLGDGLEEIGTCAFEECRSQEKFVIPDAVEKIEYGAFGGCRRLTAETLGEGLEEIRKEAFEECTSLQRIVVPNAVEVIDGSAYKNCSNLTNVEFCDETKNSCPAATVWFIIGAMKTKMAMNNEDDDDDEDDDVRNEDDDSDEDEG